MNQRDGATGGEFSASDVRAGTRDHGTDRSFVGPSSDGRSVAGEASPRRSATRRARSAFHLSGAVFDLDGVVTATATSHFRAWKDTFESFLRDTDREADPSFTYEDDYVPYVDGRPRFDGVADFLRSRDIDLPWGEASDEPGHDTVCALGNKKNAAFLKTVEEDGVEIYESTVRMIEHLKMRAVRVGLATSSANAAEVLAAAGLEHLFETVVDGNVSDELGLDGKPAADIFVTAAQRLGLQPADCIMVEDAYAGVEAGRNGNFALVIGVSRAGDPQELAARGADIVVSDLSELAFQDLHTWFFQGVYESSWRLEYHGFDPEEERLREALTTVGNGYLGSRGAYVGTGIDDDVHYPATYLAGLFNNRGTDVAGRTVYNNDFVNIPNWARADIRVGDGQPLRPQTHAVTRWHHWTDLRDAITHHDIVFEDERGRRTRVETMRFVSMDQAHLACLRCTVTALNHTDPIVVESTLDGDVINYGVERYRKLESTHLEEARGERLGEDLRLTTRTNESGITVTLQAHHRVAGSTRATPDGATPAGTASVNRQVFYGPSAVGERFTLPGTDGGTRAAEDNGAAATALDSSFQDSAAQNGGAGIAHDSSVQDSAAQNGGGGAAQDSSAQESAAQDGRSIPSAPSSRSIPSTPSIPSVRSVASDRSIPSAHTPVVPRHASSGEPTTTGRSLTIDKVVWIATDRDWPIEAEPMPDLSTLDLDHLHRRHAQRWHELWRTADMQIDRDRFAQRAVRLHAYHLLVSASPDHYPRMDIGLPARGIHGEAYRGHIFWDEIFEAPFYNRTFPEVTRAHLMYRYRRLDAARQIAREEGYTGALYPWQSADSGGRESQQLHYNPVSGDWDPDLSKLQHHISIAIAHNIWEYHYSTADHEFMDRYGMEMLLEIARFWASIAQYDDSDGRYHIHHVMGPDEFHETYPGAEATPEEGGFTDNAYTNIMVAWLLDRVATEYHRMQPALRRDLAARIGFHEDELDRWSHIVGNLAVVMDESGVLSQFDGYRNLAEIDWDHYRETYGNVRRMDRILKAEGDSPDNYQVSKQADVLMLWYILNPDEVVDVLGKMGYAVGDPRALITANYDYYLPRTSHGSTLSYIVHGAVMTYMEGHEAEEWRWFMQSLASDIHDTQGGTTPEGIHCGVMAASLSIIVDEFAGVDVEPNTLYLEPDLPRDWEHIGFTLRFRGDVFSVSVYRDYVSVACEGLSDVARGGDASGAPVDATRREAAHGKTAHDEAAHDEAVHDEAVHDEAAQDEAAHDEAAHGKTGGNVIGDAPPMEVRVGGTTHALQPGGRVEAWLVRE